MSRVYFNQAEKWQRRRRRTIFGVTAAGVIVLSALLFAFLSLDWSGVARLVDAPQAVAQEQAAPAPTAP
ncbi:MAG: hypothetical protein C4523_14385, partial [Myxococcales bacterium]